MKQRTLSIIKPDAVQRQLIGVIYQRFVTAKFTIVGAKMIKLSQEQAIAFYKEHQGKPFFEPLIKFMTEGPIMVQVLERDNAIQCYRELMGATDPEKATIGTLRSDYGLSQRFNSVHGSDSIESAEREIKFFFTETELTYG